ncbi:hypothetical protein JOS77_12445 [Chromobacterium haemolyticum]|nr:hypothetical protein JOS77_12445 [Chromobacterium haemolyticum]
MEFPAPVLERWQRTQPRSRKPGSGSRLLARSLPALALLLTAHVQAANLPDGGNIKAGNGNILVFDNGKQMSINQSSDKLAIDWNSFNIGNGHKVTSTSPTAPPSPSTAWWAWTAATSWGS